MVLRECYQGELRFQRGDLVGYLVHHMMTDLMALMENPEDEETVNPGDSLGRTGMVTEADTETTLSGRAHALVRRLLETGWLTAVPDESSLDEILLIPDYAIAILDVLHSIVHPVDKPYNSFVYSTYSVLRTANEERDYMFPALQGAFDNTQALLGSLRALLHNIHKFYQSLQQRNDIHSLLQEHFDEYQMLVAARTYHPLKTVDSVHRFRPRILTILRNWLLDVEVMDLLVQSMQTHRGGIDAGEARYEIIRMIQFIIDSFESMDSFLREIDRRNSAYSRSSVERIQYLLNTDRDSKGKLVEILKRAPKLTDDRPSPLYQAMAELPVYRVELADPDGLYTEPRRRQRGKPQPLRTRTDVADARFAEEARELVERANSLFSHERVVQFILSRMSADGVLHARDLRLNEVEDYLRTMVAVIKSDEPDIPYRITWDEAERSVRVGRYKIPAITFLKIADHRYETPQRTSID
ncbi:Wadjet anti-phage system protein JetA family protein [Alicyclobacillus contaminans]|uniref:Wadjet anti-phage system protein JetA family protein n=1 Tax=Alicyclobacillus contaminans TaxID=392016 RepID=UPI002480DEB6|nr:Wadjet anti-phage system protein JetA family protein [Alicyclobacillus contaminans]